MKLSDTDITRAATRAGIPKIYRSKERSLITDGGDKGRGLYDFFMAGGCKELLSGKVLEISGIDSESEAAFYLFSRSVILKAIPVAVVYAEDLIEKLQDKSSLASNSRVLAITGMTPEVVDPFGKDKPRIEYFLMQWCKSGHGLLFLTDSRLNECGIWSRKFRKFLEDRKVNDIR